MVHEAPEVVVESISQTVVEGERVEFHCNASGIPTPSITWERLGSDLPNGALDRNGLLVIPSAGPGDAGEYICKAINSEGLDRAKAQLEVVGKERITSCCKKTSVMTSKKSSYQYILFNSRFLFTIWHQNGTQVC